MAQMKPTGGMPTQKAPQILPMGNKQLPISALPTNAIHTTWKNPKLAGSPQTDSLLTILNINDTHRNVKPLLEMKTAFELISDKVKQAGGDLLKVHSGDYGIGKEKDKLRLQIELLNELGVNFATLGNHEFDIGSRGLAEQLQFGKFMTLSANIKLPKGCGLDKLYEAGRIANSAIYEENGHQYGVIGISPPDMKKCNDGTIRYFGVDVLPNEETIQAVKDEISKLEEKGINKIFLVSHGGKDLDIQIAQNTKGIDAIFGGHTHDVLDPLEPGVTVLESQNKEPVLIFQNGKNGKLFGATDFKFNKEGVVIEADSRQELSKNFEPDVNLGKLEDIITGKSPVIGRSERFIPADDVKTAENPVANFLLDYVREKLDTDIGLFNGSAIRRTLPKGDITERIAQDIFPYRDSLYVQIVKGENIKKALDHCAETFVNPKHRPGLLQVSGIRFTIGPDAKAKDIVVFDKTKNDFVPLDLQKEYRVSMDQFLIRGNEGYDFLNHPTDIVFNHPWGNGEFFIDAIKNLNGKPLNLQTDGRINVQAKLVESDDEPKGFQQKPLESPLKANTSTNQAQQTKQIVQNQPQQNVLPQKQPIKQQYQYQVPYGYYAQPIVYMVPQMPTIPMNTYMVPYTIPANPYYYN